MFKTIKIKNLKLFTNLEIYNLGQVNLIVGKNNCGKTTFLEALFFLIGATNPKLPINVNIFRGLPFLSNNLWPTYFHNLNWNNPIEIIGLRSETSEEQRLLILPKFREAVPSKGPVVETSSFINDSKPEIQLDGIELQYNKPTTPHDTLISKVFLRGNELVSEGMKERPVRGVFVSPLTEFDWKERFDAIQNRKRVQDIVSTLRKIEPRISDLRLNAVGLLLGDIGLPNLIPINLFGGGTARFLSIAMAMLDSPKGIVLIDEIDYGLHYSAQETIWNSIISWAEDLDVQVFATTHSYDCIEAFTRCTKGSLFSRESRLFRIEREENGEFKSTLFETDSLDRFLEKRWEIR